MKLSDLDGLPFTYDEVGATADGATMPAGYHHTRRRARIGDGRQRFERAGAAVLRYGMLRGAGVRVAASTEVAEVGTVVLGRLGPIPAPCRVVYVVDEPDCIGFAYGTLRGHAEIGEERFAVRFDPASGAVYSEVVAFSRHATWWSRLGAPVASTVQRVVTGRYLRAV
ncbi:MAG TPA: DUF1990 domain-containing protein [Mycobacterium sp.]|nr:DUF1990 domain-containing protein [Mycobacterium sp.]